MVYDGGKLQLAFSKRGSPVTESSPPPPPPSA